MPRKKKPEVINVPDNEMESRPRPTLDPVAREKELVGLAVDLAERQLRDGTASPSVISHFLKIGSTREFIERDILEKQALLIEAKADSITSGKQAAELYQEAIKAMSSYSGS